MLIAVLNFICSCFSGLSRLIHLRDEPITDNDSSKNYKIFPNFFWLMRDCKIKPSNDLSLTEHIIQKYLTQGLESRYNDRRSHVLTLFPSFDCHQIRHPASDEEPHLTPIYELNHNFNAEIKKAIELLCSSISYKRCLQSDEPLTSEIFVRLAKQYIQALNTDTGITDINLNWDTVCQNRLDSLSEELVLEYQSQMRYNFQWKKEISVSLIQ